MRNPCHSSSIHPPPWARRRTCFTLYWLPQIVGQQMQNMMIFIFSPLQPKAQFSLLLNLFCEHFRSTRILIKHWGYIHNKQIKKTMEKGKWKTKLELNIQTATFDISAMNSSSKASCQSDPTVSLNAELLWIAILVLMKLSLSLRNTSISHGLHLPGFKTSSSASFPGYCQAWGPPPW